MAKRLEIRSGNLNSVQAQGSGLWQGKASLKNLVRVGTDLLDSHTTLDSVTLLSVLRDTPTPTAYPELEEIEDAAGAAGFHLMKIVTHHKRGYQHDLKLVRASAVVERADFQPAASAYVS